MPGPSPAEGPTAPWWRLGTLLRRDLTPYVDVPQVGLWRLLHEGDPVAADDLPLRADTLDAAVGLGVLAPLDGYVRSTVCVLPVDLGPGPAWVACDFAWAEDLPGAAEKHVGGPGTATFTLAAAVPQLSAPDRVVDAGTGCGALAVLLARRSPAATVLAGDVNPRALRLTALTAGLSDTPVLPVLDDLRDAPATVVRDADLAVCNAPYVLGNPDARSVFRDAADEDQARVLAEGLLTRVRPGGLTLSTSSWLHRDGEDAARALADALAAPGRDVLVVERAVVTPERYAALWAADDHVHGDVQDDREHRWAAGLRGRGVTAVGAGLVAVRPGAGTAQEVVRMLDEDGPTPADVVHAWWADATGGT